MNKRLTVFTVCIAQVMQISTSAWAEKVIIKGPNVANVEYSAYLRVDSERISPTQKYIATRPTEDSRALLLQKLAVAQQEFLSGSLENAKRVYQEISDLLYFDDWKNSDLEAILFSYLRLAQLSTTQEETEQWLKKSLTISNAVPINAQLFPPPLLAQRKSLANSIPQLTLSLQVKDHTLVINGSEAVIDQGNLLKIYPGRYRVTFLSDSTAPETRTMAAEEIALWKPNQQPMYTGSCENFKSLWNSSEPSEVYGGERCKSRNDKIQLNVASTHVAQPELAPKIEIPVTPTKPIYQRGWFWVGVGAVAVVALAASQKPNNQEQKSTTYGF